MTTIGLGRRKLISASCWLYGAGHRERDPDIAEAGSLLADLSRSDRFFMESERYNHASVSSATALLIAYDRWQDQFLDGGASLSREAEDRLRAAMDSLVRYGMPELRKNAEGLIVRTNQLLEQYRPLVWMAQPLEVYMRECDQLYQAAPPASACPRWNGCLVRMRRQPVRISGRPSQKIVRPWCWVRGSVYLWKCLTGWA